MWRRHVQNLWKSWLIVRCRQYGVLRRYKMQRQLGLSNLWNYGRQLFGGDRLLQRVHVHLGELSGRSKLPCGGPIVHRAAEMLRGRRPYLPRRGLRALLS